VAPRIPRQIVPAGARLQGCQTFRNRSARLSGTHIRIPTRPTPHSAASGRKFAESFMTRMARPLDRDRSRWSNPRIECHCVHRACRTQSLGTGRKIRVLLVPTHHRPSFASTCRRFPALSVCCSVGRKTLVLYTAPPPGIRSTRNTRILALQQGSQGQIRITLCPPLGKLGPILKPMYCFKIQRRPICVPSDFEGERTKSEHWRLCSLLALWPEKAELTYSARVLHLKVPHPPAAGKAIAAC